MAYSRESERQNDALGDLLKGQTPEKRIFVSMNDEKAKPHGDIKSELTDIMKDVRMPWFCPKCDKVMKKQLDNKFWRLFNYCFDCRIDEEHKMRTDGTFDDYELERYLQNKKSIIFDQLQSITEWKETTEFSYVEPINVEGGSAHIETYKKSDKILNEAEEAIIQLQSAMTEIESKLKELNSVK